MLRRVAQESSEETKRGSGRKINDFWERRQRMRNRERRSRKRRRRTQQGRSLTEPRKFYCCLLLLIALSQI